MLLVRQLKNKGIIGTTKSVIKGIGFKRNLTFQENRKRPYSDKQNSLIGEGLPFDFCTLKELPKVVKI